ncbi:cation/multidrug efflux pump [Marinibactrum halimedae]|uniref:Cation/multidrug efflux pump n=1 Tax=Marinibactrum halimedae TaxID=1444977 RepID=A0AA37WP79_9GAMM|nr:cation/multidrug efflux pump [Marinibactrum halimedae]MCD9459474.1 cation/multidrug efflux pump [Marinibactrum halimedae]GLS28128.1 hypothetical protein GCM10007877_38470 [Marinibactrum halimedae]
MFYEATGAVFIAIGAVIGFFAAKLLLKGDWILGWIKGTFALALITCAAIVALVAMDLFSYQQVIAEKSVATLEFRRVNNQEYDVVLMTTEGEEKRFRLLGDQWQLDARVIKWPNAMAAMGVKPAYRLERIGGRYYSLEKERNAERTVHGIYEQPYRIDLWEWLRKLNMSDVGIDATYGSAAYLPMADGALYEVTLGHSGLIARPFNDAADRAVSLWE